MFTKCAFFIFWGKIFSQGRNRQNIEKENIGKGKVQGRNSWYSFLSLLDLSSLNFQHDQVIWVRHSKEGIRNI